MDLSSEKGALSGALKRHVCTSQCPHRGEFKLAKKSRVVETETGSLGVSPKNMINADNFFHERSYDSRVDGASEA